MSDKARRDWQGAVALVLAVGAVALTPSAHADTLAIDAKGTVLASCALTKGANFPADKNLSVSGSSAADGTLSCNAPFRLKVTSANGALITSAAAAAGFANSLAYTLAVNVALDGGGSASASCASGLLVTGQTSCALSPGNATGLTSGSATATARSVSLTATWTTPATPRLVAGAYSDTLTVTVGPQS